MNLTTVKDIIGYFVGKISTEIKVGSYEAVTGGYKVFTCNTKWSMLYFNAEIRVLNQQTNEYEYVDAEITEVEFNKYFVIKTLTEPILGIRLKPLHFRSGTILQTREELSADPNFASPYERTPMIFVREIAGEERQSEYSNQIERRLLEIPEIFFLAPCGKADRTNVAYEDVIYPMLNVVRLFEQVLYAERRIVSRFNSFEVKYHTKFAVNTRQGNTQWVFDEALAGAELNINIGLLVDAYNDCKCTEAIVPTNPCLNAQVSINQVSFSTVESGGQLNIIVEDTDGLEVGSKVGNKWIVPKGTICDPATYVLKNSLNATLETGSINSGASADIIAPDATYRVQYVDGTLIEEGTIPSGGSRTVNVPNIIPCANATWELRDSADVLIESGSIASGGSATITAPDGVVTITDSAAATLYVVNVKSDGTANQVIADSVITLNNTAAALISTTNVRAEDPATIVAPDGNITVNSVAFSSVESGGTENVEVRKSSGSDLVGSKQGTNWRVGDSTVNVNKSDGALISARVVMAEETAAYNVADSVITNDATTPTYTANVKATEGLVLPTQSIEVNDVVEGSILSVGTIDINLTDGVNPVVPNSVGISGRVVTVEVPSGGGSPSGIQFEFPIPIQRTSYRTGDEGWRVQNGWYDYTPPILPKVVAELDYTSANWADTLASPLIVNGVSNTHRFVDAFGAKIAGGANVVIDKLQGVAFSRNSINKANWDAAIDDALTYSITVNSILFDDWYLIGLNDILATTRMEAGVGFAQLIDLSAQIYVFSNNVYTATTNPANTAQMWHVRFASRDYNAINKTFGISVIYVHDAKSLITAP